MTLRPTAILWMVFWVAAAFGLYMMKYKVQAVKAEVAQAERQLRDEKKNLHVLTAEWTFLNRPERLRRLSAKYLDIKPMHGQQLSDLANLPGNKSDAVQKASSGDSYSSGPGITLAGGVAHEE